MLHREELREEVRERVIVDQVEREPEQGADQDPADQTAPVHDIGDHRRHEEGEYVVDADRGCKRTAVRSGGAARGCRVRARSRRSA